MNINPCKCGGKSSMRTFKHSHFGYVILCETCKKEGYGQALHISDSRLNSVEILTQLQNYTIQKWNAENEIKKEELKSSS